MVLASEEAVDIPIRYFSFKRRLYCCFAVYFKHNTEYILCLKSQHSVAIFICSLGSYFCLK